MSRLRIRNKIANNAKVDVVLVYNNKKKNKELPNSLAELRDIARDWSQLERFALRIPCSYVYLTTEIAYVTVIPRMHGLHPICIEIVPIIHTSSTSSLISRSDEQLEAHNENVTRTAMSPQDLSLVPNRTNARIASLNVILKNDTLCRALVHTEGHVAQLLLDIFQWLLDETALDEDIRRCVIVTTQRLATRSGLYPICYERKGIISTDSIAVAGGTFSDIFRAVLSGQDVCLKAIRVFTKKKQVHVLKQFSKEVILWGQLSHPNILPMYGLYHLDNRLCIVTPWMNNGDVCSYLQTNSKVDRFLLVFDIAKGLWYLHEQKIVHGDLKGLNILIDNDGRAVLCDFGIASVCDAKIRGWTTQSDPASTGGSARWQAPELFHPDTNDLSNTAASDIYALGCVIYEIYTGKLPFHEIPRKEAVVYQVLSSNQRPSKPEAHDESWQEWGLTETIWSHMEHCWKKAPDERPTAQEVVDMFSKQDDTRTKSDADILAPADFRRRTIIPPDASSIAEFFKELERMSSLQDGDERTTSSSGSS